MEIKIKDIHEFIKIKTSPVKELEEKFIYWFGSKLLSVDFSEIIDIDKDFDKLQEWQTSAQALADKVKNMVLEMDNGKCDFDSIMRMLCRICDSGVKIIQDAKDPQYTEGGREGANMFYASTAHRKNGHFGGYKGKLAHFRWNHTVYNLHEAYINKLVEIIHAVKYFEINPNANMGSLEGREVICRALPIDKSLLLKRIYEIQVLK